MYKTQQQKDVSGEIVYVYFVELIENDIKKICIDMILMRRITF